MVEVAGKREAAPAKLASNGKDAVAARGVSLARAKATKACRCCSSSVMPALGKLICGLDAAAVAAATPVGSLEKCCESV